MVRIDERVGEAELERIEGDLRCLPDASTGEIEGYSQRALTVARFQNAKAFELRGAISLPRLWRDRGKHAEADDALAPVYDGFTEGFNTAALKEAKALLDELNEVPEPRTT